MQLNDVVTMFGADLQRRYGEKIHKISLHGGFNCPNRDGSLGRGGCTFCNVASFSDEQQQQFSIQQQIALKVKKFIVLSVIWLISKLIPIPMLKFLF